MDQTSQISVKIKPSTISDVEYVKHKHETYPISGVPVRFPFKPYSTQFQMMSKIIKALNISENALLESPTGSGKSLALLCSTLAWQQQNQLNSSVVQPTTSTSCSNGDIATNDYEPSLKPTTGASPILQLHCKCTCHMSSYGNNGCISSIKVTSPPQVVTDIAPSCIINDTCCSVNNGTSSTSLGHIPTGSVLTSCKTEYGPSTAPVRVCCEDKSEFQSDDFKETKKRFRIPTSSYKLSKKRQKFVGIEYTDSEADIVDSQLLPDEHGRPTWRMTLMNDNTQVHQSGSNQLLSTNVSSTIPVNGGPSCSLCKCIIPHNATNGTSLLHPTLHLSPLVGNEKTSVPIHPPEQANRKNIKIFYGTRTHKQITQITHELARTDYATTPMVILASRDHACIHPLVSISMNKKDECKKLLDFKEGISCPYYHRVQQRLGSQSKLKEYGFSTAWDIEDLVTLGTKIKACPYYATRALIDDADIIFCPYNYLIDPLIRGQMLINLKGNILILDEAHNMEDAAREAASLSITYRQLKDIEEELTQLLQCDNLGDSRESYRIISACIHNMAGWMEAQSHDLPKKLYEENCGIWNGEDFLPYLKEIGVTAETHKLIMDHITTIKNDMFKERNETFKDKEYLSKPTMSVGALNILDSTFIIIGYLFIQESKYLNDYRIALKRTCVQQTARIGPGNYRKRRRNAPKENVWVITLYLWCLNPAVAFSELQVARTIILTSGTLSPMDSFSSELGTKFSIQLEANHVINQSQTWVYTLSHGPNGRLLNASYQFAETFEFQDEIGEVLLKVCETVPFGVLCFLSSYKMLEKLSSRWKNIGTWERILKRKYIVCEPRASDKQEFETILKTFYEHIKMATEKSVNERSDEDNESEFQQDGSLFLAVCRGKVSEGLDFADNNARAVVTVGIPFPSIKDIQVELKREYNNSLCYHRGLLSGSEWYEIQAYRAINQALGRCIRHKRDWGALILVDERFSKGQKYIKGLSKWVRQRVRHQPHFTDAISSLREFTQAHLQQEETTILDNTTLNSTALDNTTMITTEQHASIVNQPLSLHVNSASLQAPLSNHSIKSPPDTLHQTLIIPTHTNMTTFGQPKNCSTPRLTQRIVHHDSLIQSYPLIPLHDTSPSLHNPAVRPNSLNIPLAITDSPFQSEQSSPCDSSTSPLLFGDSPPPIDHMTNNSMTIVESYDQDQLNNTTLHISSESEALQESVKLLEQQLKSPPQNYRPLTLQNVPMEMQQTIRQQDVPMGGSQDISVPLDLPMAGPHDIPMTVPEDVSLNVPMGGPQDIVMTAPQDVPLNVPMTAPQDVLMTAPQDVPLNVPIDKPQDELLDVPKAEPQDVPITRSQDVPLGIPIVKQESVTSPLKETKNINCPLTKYENTLEVELDTPPYSLRRSVRTTRRRNTRYTTNIVETKPVKKQSQRAKKSLSLPQKGKNRVNPLSTISQSLVCRCGHCVVQCNTTLAPQSLEEVLILHCSDLSHSLIQSSSIISLLYSTGCCSEDLVVYCVTDESLMNYSISKVSKPHQLNAIWDDKLGICYSIIECGCGRVIGIKVNCVSPKCSQLLLGKALVCSDCVRFKDKDVTIAN